MLFFIHKNLLKYLVWVDKWRKIIENTEKSGKKWISKQVRHCVNVRHALVPLPIAHKPTDFMEYMILDLICLVVSFKTVYYTPKTEPVSLNFIYVSKAITWAIYVCFRCIIYRFEAYDETNQIQNHVLHKIRVFMCDKQWNRCLSHINAVRLCETCTCPTCMSHLFWTSFFGRFFCVFNYFTSFINSN